MHRTNANCTFSNGDCDASKSITREPRENSKVDIKEIRRKFENLSSGIDSSPLISTPTVPLRKKKSVDSLYKSKPNILNSIANTSNGHTKAANGNASSVKKISKLFELSTETEKSVKDVMCCDQFPAEFPEYSREPGDKTKRIAQNFDKLFDSPHENASSLNLVTPPVKPPRSFAHSEKSFINKTNPILKEEYSSNAEILKNNSSDVPSLLPRNASFGSECEALKEDILKNLKLRSPANIISSAAEKAPESTPSKSQVSNKSQGFLNYLKNFSNTANNLRERVRKHSSIFIDLTPTTVSPPKHYGTLKRSLSEEHIYDEPAVVLKNNSSQVLENSVDARESLHYMCTPVVKPEILQEAKTETRCRSRLSVRNMIYDSFALLRAASKDNVESTENPAIDNCEVDVSLKAIQDRIIYVRSVKSQISLSNICISPKLFEALLIININDNQPEVSFSFPSKVPDAYNYPLLPHICFPDDSLLKNVSVYQSETFQFSLLDKGEKVFGYCLRILGWPKNGLNEHPLCVKLPVAICILSSFSAALFYNKLLAEIEKHLTLPKDKCFKYISSLRKLGIPNSGASLAIPDYTEGEEVKRVVISRPLDSHIVGLEMTRALQLLDVDILVKSVASLLLERRVLLFSSSTSNLYHCCKAISSLLYPFEWPHLIVPVLPTCLTVQCYSELPYILGITSNSCSAVLELLAEHQLLIIDVDRGAVIKSCNDEDTILPKKVQRAVITALNLAKNMTDPTEMLRDIMISEAFVHMFVEMIGHYENHFFEQNGNLAFHKEGLLRNAFSHNIRSFLQWFSETQMFDAFVEEGIWRVKYRSICQSSIRTFFEKRIDEYKWELSHGSEKLSRKIGKTVRNFGEKIRGLKSN